MLGMFYLFYRTNLYKDYTDTYEQVVIILNEFNMFHRFSVFKSPQNKKDKNNWVLIIAQLQIFFEWRLNWELN